MKTVGDCQAVWEEFIKRCSDKGKLFGIEHSELEEDISQSGLNINAAEFVPNESTRTPHPPTEKTKASHKSHDVNDTLCSASSLSPPQNQQDDNSEKSKTSLFEGKRPRNDESEGTLNYHVSLEDSEPERSSDSDDAGDEWSESDDRCNPGDFAEYSDVDETVPPKNMDKIILALKAKCEEKAMKKKSRNTAKEEIYEMGIGLEPENTKEDIQSLASPFVSSAVGNSVVHEDYNMRNAGGITKIFLENMTFKYSERTERLIRQPKLKEQECLQPEYLDRLLQEEPQLYRQCTLRVTNDRLKILYGEIHDTETGDVLIEGNTRQSFDQDSVVVKLTNVPCTEETAPQSTLDGMKGEIVGTRNHAINLRERQFVCTINRENPWVMYPINRSMTPIAILRDESFKGVPIYRKVQPRSREKAVHVETVPLKEALSGKHLFVVQYLQWKPKFPFPLGIVTKTICRGCELNEGLRLLDLEYQLKEDFPYQVTNDIDRQLPTWTKIPGYERESRPHVSNAFTIDPPESRALDDALTVEALQNGNHQVGIHIADVSYFVKRGSRVDVEAQKRGTSYFKGHRDGDVLMLPKELSHDVCSLLPDKERLAVSIYLELDKDGRVQREEELNFCRTIVTSQCRLTYAEAQIIIMRCSLEGRPEVTSEIIQSICTLSLLAQKRRELRLADGSFYHFDHSDRKKDLEAHELVEEMMILANASVASYLVQRKAKLLPLRIQLPPKTRKFNEWRESFGNCAKLSLSLRRHLLQDVNCAETFVVPTSTWNCIARACRRPDYRELKHVICNDNMYPQLSVTRSSLNSFQRKAEDVRAADVPLEQRGHWSLNVLEYTRFTSPIRRYLDIEVHRLLFENEGKDPESEDIPALFRRCSFLSEKSSEFQKDCGRLRLAADLKNETHRTVAVVEVVAWDFIQLKLLSDANEYYSPKQSRVRISNLGPIEQPVVSECSSCLELKWKLRIYDASTENMERARRWKDQEAHLRKDKIRIEACLPGELNLSNVGYHIPGCLWLKVLEAVKEDNHESLNSFLKNVHDCIVDERDRLLRDCQPQGDEENEDDGNDHDLCENDDDSDDDDDDTENDDGEVDDQSGIGDEEDMKLHFTYTRLLLKVSDIVEIQLSANGMGALMLPDIQLFQLAPGINICLEHRKHADKCFAVVASKKASFQRYGSIGQYVRIWKPLLTMEAATVAVSNDDSLVLQNIEVTWEENDDGKLVGYFQLHKTFIETRQIEIFRGDYACVRVPYQTSSAINSSELFSYAAYGNYASSSGSSDVCETATEAESKDDMESLTYDMKSMERYFVGHCVFTACTENSQKFTFQLFQCSMKIPQGLRNGESRICTVEIIKQTIPSR